MDSTIFSSSEVAAAIPASAPILFSFPKCLFDFASKYVASNDK